MYYVIDTQTGQRVTSWYLTRKAAQRKADKLDMEYGAVRYSVKLYVQNAAYYGGRMP